MSDALQQEVIKLTPEEIQSIRELRSNFSTLILRRGEIYFEIKLLTEEANVIDQQFDIQKKAEVELTQTLQEKYGQGYIDLDSGVFQPGS